MKRLSILLAVLIGFAATPQPKRHPLGWRPSPHGVKAAQPLTAHPRYRAEPLPAAASVEKRLPPVYDQLNLGSCVANASAAAFDMQWKQQKKYFCFPSRLDLYQNCLKHDGVFPRDSGTFCSTALWVLRNRGILLESRWPYDPSKLGERGPIPGSQRAFHSAIKSYEVPNTDHGYSVKQAIANAHLPVVIGGYVYGQIYEATKDSPFIGMPQGPKAGGHSILVVAYDDNLVHNGIKGWVKIRNSWSESWGDNGYAWMPYAYVFNPKQMEDFFAIELVGRRPQQPKSSPVPRPVRDPRDPGYGGDVTKRPR